MVVKLTMEVGEMNNFGMFSCDSFRTKKITLNDSWTNTQELNRVFFEMVEAERERALKLMVNKESHNG